MNHVPPLVLFVHSGRSADGHLQYLKDEGLRVAEIPGEKAVARAASLQPGVIVLDFSCDGEMVAKLKTHVRIRHIPVIALAKLVGGL